jgi:CheY-like chemotaxis protein
MEEKKFVLVIEDDPFYANIYKMKLKKENIFAEVAVNGDAALLIARKQKPSLILTDLIMPGKDGFQTLKELKEDPALKDIPVVVLSNLSQAEDVQRVMDLGAKEYIVKSNVPIADLIQKIKDYLA